MTEHEEAQFECDAREIALLANGAAAAKASQRPEVGSSAWLDGQTPLTREAITQRIAAELDHAYAKHGRDQWGRHEFYAILREEVDELWDGIKHDKPQAETIEEALQVAAMVFRYLETGDRYRQPSNDQAHRSDESRPR